MRLPTGAEPVKITRLARAACAAAAIGLVTSAAGFDRGQALYENHCQSCHESWAHEREGRKVNSVSALRQRVAAWSIHSSLNWSDEEIDAVADYLNRMFYQLEE